MSVFSGFGAWVNQNFQQPHKAESKRSDENVESKLEKDKKYNNKEVSFDVGEVMKKQSQLGKDAEKKRPWFDAPPKVKVKPNQQTNNDKNKELYYDVEEVKKQSKLWRDLEKKHPWYDAPPKVKVTTKDGLCHMNIEFTIGMPPDGVYDLVANPMDEGFFQIDKFGRQLLENKSRKVLKKEGPRQIAEVDKALAWDFLWWSGAIPFKLIVDENEKVHTGTYKKEKMMFMKVFEGNWKLEPIFVDQERFCKNRLPKNREEYKKCSGGEGKLASKVIMEQIFQPSPLLNLPPVSWYIREKTIKTTTTLVTMLQDWGSKIRKAT